MITALSALLLAAALPAGSTLTLDVAASTLTYHLVHKLHRVDGTTHQLEGKAVAREDGAVLAMVRAPVATFRSGDANRDEHMLETLEAGKFPFVVFKGLGQLGAGRELPAGPLVLAGEVDLHGVKRKATVPVTVERQPDGALRVRGHFEVSLDAHAVERPALLFVKVDDTCAIDLDLVLRSDR